MVKQKNIRVHVIHGPNLNMLGKREPEIYGKKSLEDINTDLKNKAKTLGINLETFQSNHEGALIDFLQEQADSADGIIINPGALTHYGFSLLDALADTKLPIIEVHLSNIYSREEWRAESVIAPIAKGQVSGLGWRGYIAALEALAGELKGESG